jgi:hypothetical protein
MAAMSIQQILTDPKAVVASVASGVSSPIWAQWFESSWPIAAKAAPFFAIALACVQIYAVLMKHLKDK